MRFPFFSALRARLWKPGWRFPTVVVFALLVHSLWGWIEAGRFERAAERIRVAERPQGWPGWKTIAPTENAARYYEAAGALSVGGFERVDSHEREKWRKAMEPALEMLDRAAALPGCEFSPYTRNRPLGSSLAKAASARTRDLAHRGRWDEAVQSLSNSLQYLRAFRAGGRRDFSSRARPDVVETLLADVAVLMEAPPPTDLRRVRELLDVENGVNHIEAALLIERERTLGQIHGELRGYRGWHSVGLERWLMRPQIWRTGTAVLDFESAMIDASRAPWPERIQRIVRTPPTSRLARTGFGWLAAEALRIARSVAKTHALAVGLRLHEYRQAHGTLPDTLEALRAATGEKELPVDPFTGQALRYRREEGAYVVYSVGEDEKDDGGAFVIRQGSAKDYGYRIQIRK